MTKREALAYFRNAADMAAQLGISRSAVSLWDDDKPIPKVHELNIRFVLKPKKLAKKAA